MGFGVDEGGPDGYDGEDLVFAVADIGSAEGVVCGKWSDAGNAAGGGRWLTEHHRGLCCYANREASMLLHVSSIGIRRSEGGSRGVE